MYKIGLTGGIGSGKSTITNRLKELNYKIIDADKISREVLIKYPQILKNIKNAFGESVILVDGTLNRKELGRIIFDNKKNKETLEKIIIPFIVKDIFATFEEYYKLGEEIEILDAPTLIENNLHTLMDYNILISVDKKIQIERIKNRDSISEEDAIKRINSQLEEEFKAKFVDVVIKNNNDIEETIENVIEVIRSLQNK